MKKIIYFLASLLVLAALGSVFFLYVLPKMVQDNFVPDFKPKEIIQVHTIVLEEVQGLSKMELSKYVFNDDFRYQFKIDNWPDPIIDMKAYGEVVACVDFAKVDSNDIKVIGDTLILSLPDPEICYAKVNHDKSKIIETHYTKIYPETQKLYENAYQAAENRMNDEALNFGILDSARMGAEKTLIPLLKNLTQKDVFIKFPSRKLVPKVEKPESIKLPVEVKPSSIR
ncbi:MAG: DUF4230 domain-containing protein [Bacteroidia bacterium]|nr:DUF4230 domain-containing protein [Bacteroidia bacterium]